MENRIAEILESEAEEISILHLLDGTERRLIAPLFRMERYEAGSVCVEEGRRMNFIGIIASGR